MKTSKKKILPKFNLLFYLLVQLTLVRFLQFRYNLHGKNVRLFRKLKPPFIVLPNHVTFWDPVLVSAFIPHRIYFVMSDANLRNSLARFLYLKIARVIPKTKALADSKAVRHIIQLVRQKRVLCIFPEGRASWDGVTHDIFEATAKLLRVMKAPVVVPILKGGYLSRPRWSPHLRRGRMEIEYIQLFEGPELAKMSSEEIHQKLVEALANDDNAFQKETGYTYKTPNGAEFLERLLFACPECEQMNTLFSDGNKFHCTHCSAEWHWTPEGRLSKLRDNKQTETTVRKWNQWQLKLLAQKISANTGEPIFSDPIVHIKTGYKLEPLQEWISGASALYTNRIEITEPNGHVATFQLDEIEGAQVLLEN
ncbi:1-acyl-sn-glycerol-3-phosphate acyltransferase, partial [bacterium]|nr:1-acyl-sn-glycerol-3-phosphate acyltransferase [bacterium]